MLLCAASWQGSRNSLRDFLLVRGCQLLQLPTSFWGKGTYELNLLLVSSVHGVGSPVVGFVVAVLVVEIGGLLPLVGAAAIVARSRYGCGLSDSGRGEGGEGLGFGSVPAVVGVVGGRCNWRREMLGGPLVGDGSLSWNDRSRDAPAQGVGARAAGAAGPADNDKDLAGQGPGVGAMAIIMDGSIPFVFKTSDKPKKSVYS